METHYEFDRVDHWVFNKRSSKESEKVSEQKLRNSKLEDKNYKIDKVRGVKLLESKVTNDVFRLDFFSTYVG